MRLELLPQQGLEATRYMERYVNNVKPGRHADWSDTSVDFSPHAGLEEFQLPVYCLPAGAVHLLLSNPDPLLLNEVCGAEGIRFFVHPEMASDRGYLEEAGIEPSTRTDDVYLVTPTASTRTLLTRGRTPEFMIKTDLDRRHYRFVRRLKGSSVQHSLHMSQDLEGITGRDHIPEYAFLPESIGIVAGDMQQGAGEILRETKPRPSATDARTLVPYFSLYARDLKHPEDLPLLIQIVRRNTVSSEALHFLIHEIIGRIVRTWSHFARAYGLLLEMHGQNTLLEIDANLRPQRIVQRDFQSTYVDRQTREENGLDMPFKKHLVGEESGTSVPAQYSIVYDHEIGDFLLDRLTKTFCDYYPQFGYQRVVAEVKGVFRQSFPDAARKFPPHTYTYGRQVGNDVDLVLKHSEPVFR